MRLSLFQNKLTFKCEAQIATGDIHRSSISASDIAFLLPLLFHFESCTLLASTMTTHPERDVKAESGRNLSSRLSHLTWVSLLFEKWL